jgi:hypothetical protein
MRSPGPNGRNRIAGRASKARLSIDNKEDVRPFAPLRGLIFIIFVAVSVRLATVAASITWKRVLACPK